MNVLVDAGACTIQTGLQHSIKNNLHVTNFVSGSLKGSTLEILLQETTKKRGNTVLLIITKPDETKQILKIFHTKEGYYQTRLFLDNNYPDETYSINAEYGNKESLVSFQIQSKYFS